MTRDELEVERLPRLVGVEWMVRREEAIFAERWGAFMRENAARAERQARYV